jgi:hypothetical protein
MTVERIVRIVAGFFIMLSLRWRTFPARST